MRPKNFLYNNEEVNDVIRKTEALKFDNINKPKGYTMGEIECIDAIESAVTGLSGFESYLTGNCIKYLWRWKHKNGLEDIKKCKVYLEWLEELIAENNMMIAKNKDVSWLFDKEEDGVMHYVDAGEGESKSVEEHLGKVKCSDNDFMQTKLGAIYPIKERPDGSAFEYFKDIQDMWKKQVSEFNDYQLKIMTPFGWKQMIINAETPEQCIEILNKHIELKEYKQEEWDSIWSMTCEKFPDKIFWRRHTGIGFNDKDVDMKKLIRNSTFGNKAFAFKDEETVKIIPQNIDLDDLKPGDLTPEEVIAIADVRYSLDYWKKCIDWDVAHKKLSTPRSTLNASKNYLDADSWCELNDYYNEKLPKASRLPVWKNQLDDIKGIIHRPQEVVDILNDAIVDLNKPEMDGLLIHFFDKFPDIDIMPEYDKETLIKYVLKKPNDSQIRQSQ